jgi:hypothetical protein
VLYPLSYEGRTYRKVAENSLGRSRPPHLLGQFSGRRSGAHSSAKTTSHSEQSRAWVELVRNCDGF